MLVRTRHQRQKRQRRGIVLVLVLAMMGLLAVIGVTFATLSAQAKINARNFAQSVIQPQDDELMDFALEQLIMDTGDVRSAIRGHSLVRDMYGNDAATNGYLASRPLTGDAIQFTNVQPAPNAPGYYDVLTNLKIPSVDPTMYGYNFQRWTARISYIGPQPSGNILYPRAVSQTFEILIDDYSPSSNLTSFSGQGYHAFRIGLIDPAITTPTNPAPTYGYPMPYGQTVLNNPSLGFTTPGMFPGWDTPGGSGQLNLAYVPTQMALMQSQPLFSFLSNNNYLNSNNYQVTLDGRWLHAFNGPGLGSQSTSVQIADPNYGNLSLNVPLSTYGNFRYNGGLLAGNQLAVQPGHPNLVGMDEDYDACDLDNWFLAIQSADGQVTIPSFHRPGVVRYQDSNNAYDWSAAFRALDPADSMSRILRPVAADGHDSNTFHDLTPDPTTGKITYDVDNDADGITDSVWVDLGYPARRDARGNLYKPLFAFMVIGLNGRIPVNTAGNLAANGAKHAQHLGNSVSEIDPTYSLQNAFTFPMMSGPGTFVPPGDMDPFNQLGNTVNGPTFNGPGGYPFNYNTQVDNAINAVQSGNNNNYGMYQSVDVRLTQLRNLLAGTRPQTNPLNANTATNGDRNIIYGSWGGQTNAGAPYYLPNGIADQADVSQPYSPSPNVTFPLVQRLTPPVAGRWGEASSIAGVGFVVPSGKPLNLVQPTYVNPPRAGYSFDIADMITAASSGYGYDSNGDPMFPRDGADDNYNAFDVWPPRLTGEINDSDLYDSAGALLLPVERMRRFVTPVDINGTGLVGYWGATGNLSNYGPDALGRVQFNSYFRPAGSPGVINITTPFTGTTGNEYPYGAITAGPGAPYGVWYDGTPLQWQAGTTYTYLPDVTNNQLHGFEVNRLPNQYQYPGTTASTSPTDPATIGGMPIDENQSTGSSYFPAALPTYDPTVNSKGNQHDGVNDADEMNLYSLNPLLDSPFGPADLEWLYRQQDVDGASLTSRLSQLAPISFTNAIDGQRRRRLFALQSWEPTSYAWTNDNPGGAFSNNARFAPLQSATMRQYSFNYGGLYSTPALAHRDRKINLNFPLPVSNDCNEPIRQRWISDTYQLFKMILPPTAVDSPEELAQLSQYVINIIDFRDPDATMTHWVNPDVLLAVGATPASLTGTTYTISMGTGATPQVYTTPPSLVMAGSPIPAGITTMQLDQFGVEYNPVAINEVLAYAFQSRSTAAASSAKYTNRIFVELVNTLTAAYNPQYDATTPTDPQNYYGYGTSPYPGGNSNNNTQPPYQNTNGASFGNATKPNYPLQAQASTLDLGGFSYLKNDPYGGGCWDLVFTLDNPMSRPDPFRGDLVYNPSAVTYFSLVPLNRDALTPTAGGTGGPNTMAPNGGDVTLIPISPGATATSSTGSAPGSLFNPPPYSTTPPTAGTPPINYFYVVGSPPGNEYPPNSIGTTLAPGSNYASVTQYFSTYYDPMGSASATGPPGFIWRQGILPGVQAGGTGTLTQPTNYSWDLPVFGGAGTTATNTTPPLTPGGATYYWVCLRRPANPFAPVSKTNPMVVVDSMRFPYIDGTANASQSWNSANNNGQAPWSVLPTAAGATGTATANTIFSAQRLQPYRGGHAVPMPNAPGTLAAPGATGPIVTMMPPDPRYGYTEQIASPATYTLGVASTGTGGATAAGVYGLANTGASTTPYASTNVIYHTLGFYNDSAENWDYFVFNDRDFSSVAELLLVPGCPPGLFTKQFVEFAASQMNAANIFSRVTPVYVPGFPAPFLNIPAGPVFAQTGTTGTQVPPTTFPAPFTSATVPFLDVTLATSTSPVGSASTALPNAVPNFSTASGGGANSNGITYPYSQPAFNNNTPVQPHAFPYLVDRFFYTGASTFFYPPTGAVIDPGSPTLLTNKVPVVGGPGGDGWYKMFEFFEVPSQSNGAVGPVALGANFDWARQDTKPGLMNLNLIVDEEAFYAVFGSNNSRNSRSFNQAVLNSIQLPLLATYHPNTGQLTVPYNMPLIHNTYNGNVQPNPTGLPPIPQGGPPVPLVVSAIQPTGAPNYVYPITDQTQLSHHGYLANDPILEQLNVAATGSAGSPGTMAMPGIVGNRIKAAFAQFLWARHGGSGYVFGYGNGNTGQNSAVFTPGIGQYNLPLPIERPFRSLSYPDINFTVMRPAALPPSRATNPATLQNPTAPYNLFYNPVALALDQSYTAQSLYVTQTPYAPTMMPPLPYATPPFFSPAAGAAVAPLGYFYSPYITSNTTNFTTNGSVPIVYTGDPGVRSPFFNQGYASSGLVYPNSPTGATLPYATYSASTPLPTQPTSFNVLAGVPLPTNVAFPTGNTTNPAATDSVVMPPPIPPARLFQIPDSYGRGLLRSLNYMGLWSENGQPTGTVPPAVSNASDSGDPYINNAIANQMLNPYISNGGSYPPTFTPSSIPLYTLNYGFMSLIWAGGRFFNSSSVNGASQPIAPYLSSTGVLPPASINYAPYTAPYLNLNLSNNPANLSYANGYISNGTAPTAAVGTPYYGGQTAGSETDDRQHPYWRTELMQKAMNLTTVRTHQYAVWITVGFFEVKRRGDIGMMAQGQPQLAFDIMGAEVGAQNGQATRFRGFFIVDRLQITGFNPADIGGFRKAVVYRKMIE